MTITTIYLLKFFNIFFWEFSSHYIHHALNTCQRENTLLASFTGGHCVVGQHLANTMQGREEHFVLQQTRL